MSVDMSIVGRHVGQLSVDISAESVDRQRSLLHVIPKEFKIIQLKDLYHFQSEYIVSHCNLKVLLHCAIFLTNLPHNAAAVAGEIAQCTSVLNSQVHCSLGTIMSQAEIYDGPQGTCCKQKRCAANKKDALQTKKKRCKQKRNAANKKRELQIKETLQTKNECCKQKTNVANKKRTLQTRNERCK